MYVGKRPRLTSGGVLAALLLTLTLLLAGCGSTPSNEVDMGVAAFQQTRSRSRSGRPSISSIRQAVARTSSVWAKA